MLVQGSSARSFEASRPTETRHAPAAPPSPLELFSPHTCALWSFSFGCRLAGLAANILNPDSRGSVLLAALDVLAAVFGTVAALSVAIDAMRANERGYWSGYAKCAVDLLGERRRPAAPVQRTHRPSPHRR